MMWSVKAVFTERTSGIAAVAAAVAEQGMALVDLRSTTGWQGQVVDEFVLATPAGWTLGRLQETLMLAGAASARVVHVDVARPDEHVNAERKARLAHPAGSHRAWRAMREAS